MGCAFEFDDTPTGLTDADQEMAALEAAGRRDARLRARGVCSHGWIQGAPGNDPGLFDRSPVRCLHDGCGATFATGLDWYAARRAALGGAR